MKRVVLLVDDNEDILLFLGNELMEHYEIIKAYDGKEALEVLSGNVVELIVSDIMMPGMDGLELCKIIKSDVAYSHIPLILLTAKNTMRSKIEGLEIGADAYVEKPFDPEYLKVQIANLIANRSKVKEHFANSPLVLLKSMANSKTDEKFLEKLQDEILNHIEDTSLDVNLLAKYLNMSRPTLYRTIKSISGMTPLELITITRLKRAAELLSERTYKIYEVAELTGFASQNYFGRNFMKQFGMTPTEYMATKNNTVNSESIV